MDKEAKRIAVLLEWRELALRRGHAVPSREDVGLIGRTGEIWPPGIDVEAAEPWRSAIEFLLTQVKFGMHDPLEHMPGGLEAPAVVTRRRRPPPDVQPGPNPPNPRTENMGAAPSTAAADDDVVFTALKKWQAAGQRVNPTLSGLKDSSLRSIARRRSAAEADIRQHLPESLRGLTTEMARVIGPVLGASSPHRPPAEPEPLQAPAAIPAPADAGDAGRPTPAAPDRSDTRLGALDLADYLYGTESETVHPVRSRQVPSATALSWPDFGTNEPVVLYRVVATDDTYPAMRPQDADPVAVTHSLKCIDARPFQAPVRHLQVWCHIGSTDDDAADAEPVLHAETSMVASVQDAHVTQDGDAVVAHWTVPPGVDRVQVLRVPRELMRGGGLTDPGHRILEDRTNLDGFVDDGVERGRSYVYALSVEADVNGERRLSTPPVQREVSVSAVLRPVEDLVVSLGDADSNERDLFWTPPPGGEVRVYRTAEPPAAGVGERPLAVAALAGARLTDETRLRRPTDRLPDGRVAMLRVPWKENVSRLYFTPVTVVDDMAYVGTPASAIAQRAVEEAVIVERTFEQLLTFAWPDGADMVVAFEGPPGQDAAGAMRSNPHEVTRDQYERQGGLHFPKQLSPRGCRVHVFPVTFSARKQIIGPATAIDYPGMLRLRYTLSAQHDRAGQPVSVGVQIISQFDDASQVFAGFARVPAPMFTLVHQPEWLPLHSTDGSSLHLTPQGDPNAAPGTHVRPSSLHTRPDTTWTASVSGLTGYLRLFVCLPPEQAGRVALIDPPISDLRLSPRATSRGGR